MKYADYIYAPPQLRLNYFLSDRLDCDGELDENCRKLSAYLGYTNHIQVKNWVVREHRVDLDHLVALADYFNVDLGQLLFLWLSQRMDDSADVFLKEAAKRMLTANEFALVQPVLDLNAEDQLGEEK